MNKQYDELEQLKSEKAMLLKCLQELDERIVLLARTVHQSQINDFKKRYNVELSYGSVIKVTDAIRAYCSSNFIAHMNPDILVMDRAVVIGFEIEQENVLLGAEMQDPTPVSIPITLLQDHIKRLETL